MEIKTNAKIRVRLESFNHELLVASCKKITDTLSNTSLNSIGLVTSGGQPGNQTFAHEVAHIMGLDHASDNKDQEVILYRNKT